MIHIWYIYIYILIGGSLKGLIDKFGKLEEPVCRSYTRQILLGIHIFSKFEI